jgi:hypothetical protein
MCEQFAGVDLEEHARLIAAEVERVRPERDQHRKPDRGEPRSDGTREAA